MKFVFAFLFVLLFRHDTFYAYLDPGMGTMLLQLLAGAALFIGIGWRFILRFFRRLLNRLKGSGK